MKWTCCKFVHLHKKRERRRRKQRWRYTGRDESNFSSQNTDIFGSDRMLSRTVSKRTKSAPILDVIMAAIYSSFIIVFFFADEVLSETVKNHQRSSHVPTHSDEVQGHKSVFDSTDLFIPLIDTKHLSNSKTSDASFENLKNSKIFQKYKKEKVHVLSSASASALLSSSTLSVDELPKPQVQKQTPTGATSTLKKKDNTTHHHKHQHRNKHHNKKRHHKNGHKQKRTTESSSNEDILTTSSSEIAFDVMEGNDLNFLSASSASIHATSHILPLSTTYPSITPKYTLIDSSEPSKQQSQSLNNNTGIKGGDDVNSTLNRKKIVEEDNFCSHAPNKHLCLPVDYSKFELPHRDDVNIVEIGIDISDVLKINDDEYSVTFSSYFNVLWNEPRLHISAQFLQELNATEPGGGDDKMIPVNLDLVNELWLPNIFIYNLKTFKVVEVLSKHAGLWITTAKDVFYSQAVHITFICPMRFDAFPLDTQLCKFQVGSYSYDDTKMIFLESGRVKGYVETSRSIVLDYDVKIKTLSIKDRVLSYGSLGNYSLAGFEMKLHRFVSHYIITYYLPSGLFVAVSWISFIVPPDVIPGRLTLLITLFLVLVNIFNGVTTNTPKAEGLTAIETWMLACILFVFGALVEYAAILFRKQKVAKKELPRKVQESRMQVLLDAAATSMMGIRDPNPPWEDAPAEQMVENVQQFPSSTSLCGIAGCPHHQVMVLPTHADDCSPSAGVGKPIDPSRGDVMQPHFHPHPHHTSCNMTSAETMTSPVMTSGTTIANHYGLHHNTSSALPPHHPHYPNQRTFVRHHIGGSALIAEDQQIELEGTTNGNGSQPRNRNELEMRTVNKSIWNCCPMCAKAQNSESQKHKGKGIAYGEDDDNREGRENHKDTKFSHKRAFCDGDNYFHTDRFFLVASPVVFLIFNIVYWMSYGSQFYLAELELEDEGQSG